MLTTHRPEKAPLLLLLLLLFQPVLAQDWAREQLESSPRHIESVKVRHGERVVNTLVIYPERPDKAMAVLVIHEIFGLSDWARLQADQLAEAGYIAVVPDLLSGMAPGGKGTDGFADSNAVRGAVRELPPDQVTADLKAVSDYALKLPACNGKLVVGGFCWGGSQSFRFATNSDQISAAFVFYGTGPDNDEELKRIKVPVYGFYAENDARVNATLEATTASMKKLGKTFSPEVYQGAGHGFMRAGVAPDASAENAKARNMAWTRWLELLESL